MTTKKYFCEKCGRKIKKRELPYCENCKMEIYLSLKKRSKNKKKEK